jgi:hypothetical protein
MARTNVTRLRRNELRFLCADSWRGVQITHHRPIRRGDSVGTRDRIKQDGQDAQMEGQELTQRALNFKSDHGLAAANEVHLVNYLTPPRASRLAGHEPLFLESLTGSGFEGPLRIAQSWSSALRRRTGVPQCLLDL